MRMKTAPIATILASAYLSAMLTSSLAPIRNNTIFAAAVDPSAAEKALQNAVSGLDIAGWATATAGTPATEQPAPKSTPALVQEVDPVMTEELLARLIGFTLTKGKKSTVPKNLCKTLGISDGTADVPTLQASEPLPEGKHYITLVTLEGSEDIIFWFRNTQTTFMDIFLTDKSGVLRAAAVWDAKEPRLITNEQAAEKYKAEMKLFAKLAQDLPPAVPGNS